MGGGPGLHLFVTPLAQASACVAAVVFLAAVIWGRWPERLGALAIAANWIGSALLEDRRWNHHGQPGIFAADAAMLLAFILITLRCQRIWVLWAAACTLLLNFTDLALLLDTRIQLWSYMSASNLWGFGVLVALAAGVVFEGRRAAPILAIASPIKVR
jgi:hypothetical protein